MPNRPIEIIGRFYDYDKVKALTKKFNNSFKDNQQIKQSNLNRIFEKENLNINVTVPVRVSK